TPEAEGLRLVSSTTGGKRFVVVLKRDGKGDQERTRVRVEWEDGRDEETQVKINALLEALKAKCRARKKRWRCLAPPPLLKVGQHHKTSHRRRAPGGHPWVRPPPGRNIGTG